MKKRDTWLPLMTIRLPMLPPQSQWLYLTSLRTSLLPSDLLLTSLSLLGNSMKETSQLDPSSSSTHTYSRSTSLSTSLEPSGDGSGSQWSMLSRSSSFWKKKILFRMLVETSARFSRERLNSRMSVSNTQTFLKTLTSLRNSTSLFLLANQWLLLEQLVVERVLS